MVESSIKLIADFFLQFKILPEWTILTSEIFPPNFKDKVDIIISMIKFNDFHRIVNKLPN
jgi:hypothetical protein